MHTIKEKLIQAMIADLDIQMAAMHNSIREAMEESKFHKGAMVSRYDTFKEEAQSKADALQGQLLQLGKIVSALRTASVGRKTDIIGAYSLVQLEDSTEKRFMVFLVPIGGGNEFKVENETILCLTTGTPIGKAMMGRKANDRVEFIVAGRTSEYRIISVE